jgi:hypothetical protein
MTDDGADARCAPRACAQAAGRHDENDPNAEICRTFDPDADEKISGARGRMGRRELWLLIGHYWQDLQRELLAGQLGVAEGHGQFFRPHPLRLQLRKSLVET